MSIYLRCSSRNRSLKKIEERIQYVFDPKKSRPDLCHATGAKCESVFQDFLFIKRLYCKTDGRQYLHWVLSHDKNVDESIANSVAVEVLKLIGENFQAIAGTHLDRANVHTHFLLNTVGFSDGKKFNESKSEMLRFRGKINNILRKYGLRSVEAIVEIREEKLEEQIPEKEEIPLIQYKNGNTWQGCGSMGTDGFMMPGVWYMKPICAQPKEQKLVPGVIYEEKKEISRVELTVETNEGVFSNYGIVKKERIFSPGILYKKF